MSGTQTEQKIESHNNIFQIRLLSLASAPDPEMWIIQGTLAWRGLWTNKEQMMISLLHIRIGFKEEVALLQAMED
ncbi:hypothetical protein V6N13_136135 [Hibiscus sabdariffa]